MSALDLFLYNSEGAFLLPKEETDFVRQRNWPGFFTLLHIIASDSNKLGPDKKALKLEKKSSFVLAKGQVWPIIFQYIQAYLTVCGF